MKNKKKQLEPTLNNEEFINASTTPEEKIDPTKDTHIHKEIRSLHAKPNSLVVHKMKHKIILVVSTGDII